MNPGLAALLLCFAVFDSAILAPMLIMKKLGRRKRRDKQSEQNKKTGSDR